MADLVGWAQLRSGRVSDLGSDGIQRLLAGPMWRSFLDAVDRTGPTSLLLDCLLDPEIAPVLSRRLARPNRALSDQLARAVAQPVGLDVRGQGQLQDQLIAALGRKEFQARVLPGVLDLARQGVPVKIASTPLADLVAEAARAADGVPVTAFTWYAETSAWSAMTDLRLEAWVADGGSLPPGLRDACAREPVAFGAAVDEMIADRRHTPAALIKRLRDWPDADLEVLVTGLLETARTTRLFILDVLGARDPQRRPAAASPVLDPDRRPRRLQSRAHRAARGGRRPEAVVLALDPGVTSFSLATYQPVAFHAYPELMRARRAAPPAPADDGSGARRAVARSRSGGRRP